MDFNDMQSWHLSDYISHKDDLSEGNEERVRNAGFHQELNSGFHQELNSGSMTGNTTQPWLPDKHKTFHRKGLVHTM